MFSSGSGCPQPGLPVFSGWIFLFSAVWRDTTKKAVLFHRGVVYSFKQVPPPWGVEPLSYGVRRPAGRFLIGRAQDGAGCGAGASPPTARQGRAGGGPARAAQKRGAAAGRRRVTTRGIAPRTLLRPAFSAIYIGDHRRGPPGPGLYFLAQKRSVRAVVSSVVSLWGPHKADLWLCGERRSKEANVVFATGGNYVEQTLLRRKPRVANRRGVTTT